MTSLKSFLESVPDVHEQPLRSSHINRASRSQLMKPSQIQPLSTISYSIGSISFEVNISSFSILYYPSAIKTSEKCRLTRPAWDLTANPRKVPPKNLMQKNLVPVLKRSKRGSLKAQLQMVG
jgi:hypothetical protein